MSAKVIPGGHLHLFPNSSCSMTRCGSTQLSFGSSPSHDLTKLGEPRRLALRTRAKATVCAPAQSSTPESFYQLLGIPETGSISEIKRAYKQLARKYHPDVSPTDRTEEYTKRFIKVQEAYETLSDPQTRAMYDMDLARGLQFNFSTRGRRRYERMGEEEEWKRRWQTQLDELRRRSMQRDSASGSGSARGRSPSRGSRTRRRRNNIFDVGFN